MFFDKEDILLKLQEKANEKIEILRHELAQSLFDQLSEELYFVYDKDKEEVIDGPFKTEQDAVSYIKNTENKNLVVITGDELINY